MCGVYKTCALFETPKKVTLCRPATRTYAAQLFLSGEKHQIVTRTATQLLPILKAVCADVLIRELRVDNCLELLDMAYKYNIGELKRPASDLLIINRDHRGATFGL